MKFVTNPDEFFAELKNREPKLIYPAIILLAISIVSGYYQFVLLTKLSETFPEDFAKFLKIGATFGVFGAILTTFALWLVVAGIMFGITSIFGGEGSFKRTLEFVGYGFFPMLVSSLITVPISVSYISNAKLPKMSIQDLQQNPELFKSVMYSMVPHDVIISNLIISSAALIWSFVIWSFALKHARGLELRKAAISVLIPAAIYGAYVVFAARSI